jgi:RNA polymerase sigma-70 factor (ECF subfamily)
VPAAFGPTPAATTALDEELLRGVRQGQESALTALYDRYAGYVYAVALRVLGDRHLAEEVLQDTFLNCWNRVETYQPARGRVVAWLIGIARHRAVDVLRSRSNQARRRETATLTETNEIPTPDDTDLFLLRDVLSNALAELPQEQRQVIELAYYGGLTQGEISQQVGAPLGTIKTRTRAAMERLRNALRPALSPESGDGSP